MNKIVFLLGVLLIAASISQAEDVKYGVNLVNNPGFEEGGVGWAGSGDGKLDIDTSICHSDKASLHVGSPNWIFSDFIPYNGERIHISVWVKSEDIQAGQDPWNVGRVDLRLYADETQNQLPGCPDLFAISGTTPWKEYKADLSFDKKVKYLRVQLSLHHPKKGEIWFDDVHLELLDPAAIPEGF